MKVAAGNISIKMSEDGMVTLRKTSFNNQDPKFVCSGKDFWRCVEGLQKKR